MSGGKGLDGSLDTVLSTSRTVVGRLGESRQMTRSFFVISECNLQCGKSLILSCLGRCGDLCGWTEGCLRQFRSRGFAEDVAIVLMLSALIRRRTFGWVHQADFSAGGEV